MYLTVLQDGFGKSSEALAGCYSEQVEATTEKQCIVIKGKVLFFRATKCTEIMTRPGLTGTCTVIS